MASPFDEFEVDRALRPSRDQAFDLEQTLNAVVALYARVPGDAFTANSLGPERFGHGVVIGARGLVVTIGYLITEAEEVMLLTNDRRQVPARVVGYDQVTGFGLVSALEPLDLPAMPLGDSRKLASGDAVIVAGGGGLSHALAGRLIARQPFAGYWEYLLDEALFTAPGHPHWSGAAVIGPGGALMGVTSLQMNQMRPDGRTPIINMSVPIELLPPILDDLARGQLMREPRPWLGLLSQEADEGVMVLSVTPGGPADRGELRRGDVILAVDGQTITSLADFYTRLWALGPAGVAAPLRVERDGDVFDVEIRTIDRASRLRRTQSS
ncbi:MAG TPA: S1C family serine protease [Caulobacteraceae bacterium]|nr:S1C family serine protease [Caulobacteraceae bacterium]